MSDADCLPGWGSATFEGVPEMKRIYVVEYSQLARDRIRQALEWMRTVRSSAKPRPPTKGSIGVNDLDPDIVITDLLLRDGTGVDVVKRIRARHGPDTSGDIRPDQSPESHASRHAGSGRGERRIRQSA